MKLFRGRWILAALIALALLPAAWMVAGQGYGQQPPKAPPPQPAQPGITLDSAKPPVNAEEDAARKAFMDVKATEAERKIQLGEDFLKKYPQSLYAIEIYTGLTTAYWFNSQPDKMIAAGEKALELNADNVDVLAPLAVVLPRTVGPNSLDGPQKLDKAELYSRKCLSILATLAKPEGMTDEQFTNARNEKTYMCHSGLGVTNFRRQKFVDSAAELEQGLKLTAQPDPVDYYILGIDYQQTQHFTDAVTAFGHCAEQAGPLQATCKDYWEKAKKIAATQPSAPK